jgi:hypothetical protein
MTRYHGPSLAKWLWEQPEARRLTQQRRRTVRSWERGRDPLETHVDATLCSVGLHLREIPAWAVFGLPEREVRGLEVDWDSQGNAFLTRAA